MASIDISIEFLRQQVDYRVSSEITFGRLTELMKETLKSQPIPENWRLELKDKAIRIDDTDLIKDLPIGNGDVFCIVENRR